MKDICNWTAAMPVRHIYNSKQRMGEAIPFISLGHSLVLCEEWISAYRRAHDVQKYMKCRLSHFLFTFIMDELNVSFWHSPASPRCPVSMLDRLDKNRGIIPAGLTFWLILWQRCCHPGPERDVPMLCLSMERYRTECICVFVVFMMHL